jgi:hypothetical protein
MPCKSKKSIAGCPDIDINPVEIEKSRHVIDEVLADHARA